MTKPSDTLIIFGRSPFINEVRDRIPALCERYHTVGCNYFVDSFPMVEAVAFYDDITPRVTSDHLIIARKRLGTIPMFKSYRLLKHHARKELYDIEKTKYFNTVPDSGVLSFSFHTPYMVMNWAFNKGFKRIILIGVDLIKGTRHFDSATTPDRAVATWKQSGVDRAADDLTFVDKNYLRVFQTNPKSTPNLEHVSIDSLLAENTEPTPSVATEEKPKRRRRTRKTQ